jgi:hypothetical protein
VWSENEDRYYHEVAVQEVVLPLARPLAFFRETTTLQEAQSQAVDASLNTIITDHSKFYPNCSTTNCLVVKMCSIPDFRLHVGLSQVERFTHHAREGVPGFILALIGGDDDGGGVEDDDDDEDDDDSECADDDGNDDDDDDDGDDDDSQRESGKRKRKTSASSRLSNPNGTKRGKTSAGSGDGGRTSTSPSSKGHKRKRGRGDSLSGVCRRNIYRFTSSSSCDSPVTSITITSST